MGAKEDIGKDLVLYLHGTGDAGNGVLNSSCRVKSIPLSIIISFQPHFLFFFFFFFFLLLCVSSTRWISEKDDGGSVDRWVRSGPPLRQHLPDENNFVTGRHVDECPAGDETPKPHSMLQPITASGSIICPSPHGCVSVCVRGSNSARTEMQLRCS